MDMECGICTGNLQELGGGIELPCRCKVPYCQQCWDRTLAASLSKVGLPRCPSCRVVIRADYDAKRGRLVFSRVADATIRFTDHWLESLDETLQQNGVLRTDEGTKFIARAQSGQLTKLFVMFAFQETWEKASGGLWTMLDEKIPASAAEDLREWLVVNCRGDEVLPPREPTEEEYPVQIRLPKFTEKRPGWESGVGEAAYFVKRKLFRVVFNFFTAAAQVANTAGQAVRPLVDMTPDSFPLTLTFKEYVVNIDLGLEKPDASKTFQLSQNQNQILVCEDVGLAGRWKDKGTGVCLHPGDRLLEVNGLKEPDQMLLELQRAELLKVRLQQQGSIFKIDVFNAQDDMRIRLQSQAKPRQQELLRGRSAEAPPCVCGGELELLELRQRVQLLVNPSGFLEYAGRRFSVNDLIDMQAVTCDLCQTPVKASRESHFDLEFLVQCHVSQIPKGIVLAKNLPSLTTFANAALRAAPPDVRTVLDLSIELQTGEVSEPLFLVQSEVASPDLSEQHCEKVLSVDMPLALEQIGDDDFKSLKESFRLALLQPPLSTTEEEDRFWTPILLGRCFEVTQTMLEYLESVKLSDVVAAWRGAVMPEKVREKVVIKLFGSNHEHQLDSEPELSEELADAVKQRLRSERRAGAVLRGSASSALRKKLVAMGAGYFPQTLSCTLGDASSHTEDSEAEATRSLIRRA
ncbi:unnamed protein product [Effrenium voratum]|nr:unnamed protein product [Effrenium voratum]